MLSRCRMVVFLGLIACGDFSRGEPSAGNDSGDDTVPDENTGGDTWSFAADIRPLLESRCGSCHGEGGNAARTGFVLLSSPGATYDGVLKLLDERAPENSLLLQKAAGSGHGGGAVLSPASSEYVKILSWIRQGAAP